MYTRFFLLCALIIAIGFCQDDSCDVDGLRGRCMDIRACPSAKEDLKLRIKPKICSFNESSTIPNICCLSPVTNVNISSSSTTAIPDNAECPPLKERYRPKPKQIQQGHKAWAKCVEYQSTALFPCSDPRRNSRCNTRYSLNEFGAAEDDDMGGGGKSQVSKEFPHMALIGYGNDTATARWICGGSLISDKFILTAGICVNIKYFHLGPAAFAALGSPRRSDLPFDWDIHKIIRGIEHPKLNSRSYENDIGLLEIENSVQFSHKIMPGCLHVGDEVADGIAVATGWGAFGTHGKKADILNYVPQWKFPDENCSFHFPPRGLLSGYDKITQMCYGDDGFYSRDTCAGDTGGPLQIVSRDINCMYLIIGVTSYGHLPCGKRGVPSISTRVAHFVPWIESIVWP